MPALREPERGVKSELVRQLLQQNPGGKNMEFAAMFKDKMREKGIKEDRDLDKIAQAFANEKAAAKKKPSGDGESNGAPAAAPAKKPGRKKRAVAAAAPSRPAAGGSFTLDDLLAVEELAPRVGSYKQLSGLVRFMATRGQ